MKKLILVFLLPVFFFSISLVHAEAPANGIYDPANYLSHEVETTLANYNKENDIQMGIYIVDSLEGETIEERANKIAREWSIGLSEKNKGALIAIAIKDKKFRIETSNELSVLLTDSKSRAILDNAKPYMRKADYSGAVMNIMHEIIAIQTEYSNEQTQMNTTQNHNTKSSQNEMKRVLNGAAGAAVIIGIFALVINRNKKKEQEKRLKRSQYKYNGRDKLEPKDNEFIYNESWTPNLLNNYWEEDKRKRSQYDYHGVDKLFPFMPLFIANNTWTPSRINSYKKEQERIEKKRELERQDRLKRSQHDYEGDDKLYPNDSGFIENATWTLALIAAYEAAQEAQRSANTSTSTSWSFDDYYSDNSSSSYDSSSSWSSSDWGGGGFDGGGSSSDW